MMLMTFKYKNKENPIFYLSQVAVVTGRTASKYIILHEIHAMHHVKLFFFLIVNWFTFFAMNNESYQTDSSILKAEIQI